MNHLATLFCAWALTIQFDGKTPPATAPTEETNQSAHRVLELAQKYEFFAEPAAKTKLTLAVKPLLTYSNPVRGDVQGNVFLWTHHGRPQVLAAVFDYRSEGWMDSEFHTLSSAKTVGVRDGITFWQPDKAGIEFQPIPDSPAVGKSAVNRLSHSISTNPTPSFAKTHEEG